MAETVTQQQAQQLFWYDADTGILMWRRRQVGEFASASRCAAWNARWCGKEAGSLRADGYRMVRVNYQRHFVHRLIWLLVQGEWPQFIDHINGDRADNRLSNLRSVSHGINMQNQAKPRHNTSGVVGVYWHGQAKKWAARIEGSGKLLHLGLFDTIEAAARTRKLSEDHYGFHPNHGRRANG